MNPPIKYQESELQSFTMPLAMAFDDHYLVPALVSIFTARETCRTHFRLVVVFDPGRLSLDSREFLSKICSSLGVNLQMISFQLPDFLKTHGHFSEATYTRLFMPKLIGVPFLYIDADTIFEAGWQEIEVEVSHETSGSIAYALRGVTHNTSHLSSSNSAVSASRGKYLNAGVLIFDPNLLADDFEDRVREACRNYDELGLQWVDQCVLNYVMKGRVGLIKPSFNVLLSLNSKKPSHARILHFVGAEKPWVAVHRFRYLFSYPVRKWWASARRLARYLDESEVENREFRIKVRRIATVDGINPKTLGLAKKILLPILRSLFSKL
jgi:lipopolysaccharide biosynthesis glycosyltransferase